MTLEQIVKLVEAFEKASGFDVSFYAGYTGPLVYVKATRFVGSQRIQSQKWLLADTNWCESFMVLEACKAAALEVLNLKGDK